MALLGVSSLRYDLFKLRIIVAIPALFLRLIFIDWPFFMRDDPPPRPKPQETGGALYVYINHRKITQKFFTTFLPDFL